METPENKEAEKPSNSSLLNEIIQASTQKGDPSVTENTLSNRETQETSPMSSTLEAIKKPREPMSPSMILKLLGSILFVSTIFFGSYLSYIVFNPDKAVFFMNALGIDRNDIANFLKLLINWSFGAIMLIVSIGWIISLFRAFWTSKEFKRKRLLAWLTSGIIGIILFSILTFWAYLFNKIDMIPWDNPDGAILVYDNDLYTHGKNYALLKKTSNLIGPINLAFDIRVNASQTAKANLFQIDSFEINFDGALCNDEKSVFIGSDPFKEQSIVCSFNQVKTYNIHGVYKGKNRLGEPSEIQMILNPVEIRGLVDMKKQKNAQWERIITLDASKVRQSWLWTPRWLYDGSDKEVATSSITNTLSPIAQVVCLKVYDTQCDRFFILEDKDSRKLEWSIDVQQDSLDYRVFHFSFTGSNINQNEVTRIEWRLDNEILMCKAGEYTCSYMFVSPGKKKVNLNIETAAGDKFSFEKEIEVKEPIKIIRHAKVVNDKGNILNDETTYDRDLRSYVLDNVVVPPETITLDARDVVSDNPGYIISQIDWKISNGKTIEEKRGNEIKVTLNEPLRYTIEGTYTFIKQNPIVGDTPEIAKDNIIINIERKSLIPRLKIQSSSDYVPSLITVDASESETDNGEIKKFIFDFGENKVPAEGDAITQYTYTSAGEKTITLTVVDENGKQASLKKTIVLKDQAKTAEWEPSITPGIVGSTIDFEAKWTNGQAQEYIWNFGDNTPLDRGYSVTHTYAKSGNYPVTLTVIYTDGTEQSKKKIFEVRESL